jgi:hypothetical protein
MQVTVWSSVAGSITQHCYQAWRQCCGGSGSSPAISTCSCSQLAIAHKQQQDKVSGEVPIGPSIFLFRVLYAVAWLRYIISKLGQACSQDSLSTPAGCRSFFPEKLM